MPILAMTWVSDKVYGFLKKLNSNVFYLIKLSWALFGQGLDLDNGIRQEDGFVNILKLCLVSIKLMLNEI